jgi:hypothetical protein
MQPTADQRLAQLRRLVLLEIGKNLLWWTGTVVVVVLVQALR